MKKVYWFAWLVAAYLLGAVAALAQQPGSSGPSTGTGYPAGSIPILNTSSGADTASVAVNLPATALAGRLPYVCGFSVSGLGATAIGNVIVTLGSLYGGVTLNWQYSMPAGATVPASPLVVALPDCLPGNTVGGQVTITVPGAAGNTSTAINIWGYAL